jgi:hypothetical protein
MSARFRTSPSACPPPAAQPAVRRMTAALNPKIKIPSPGIEISDLGVEIFFIYK